MQNNSLEKSSLVTAVARITFLSLAEKIKLYKNLDSVHSLALMSLTDISRLVSRELSRATWNPKENCDSAIVEAKMLESKGIGFLLYEDSGYPVLLKETVNAPFALFYRGNVNALYAPSVSMVGSRMVTPAGKKATYDFAYKASSEGVSVVSGLARGVDGESHKAALDAYYDKLEQGESSGENKGSVTADGIGKTIAVLPCGIDTVFPTSHRALAEKIIKTGGVLVSEYVPGTPAEKFRFVQRNRIIAALSPCTVVTEAPDGSGSLITADYAIEYNRDLVFLSSCFSSSAEEVRKSLRAKSAEGSSQKSGKSSRRLENYLEMGAPVVQDYEDFKKFLSEEPGKRSCIKC